MAIFLVNIVRAQENPRAIPNKFLTALKNDTGYSRFQAEVNGWIKKAKGRNTNSLQVKQIFQRNSALLTNLKNKYGGEATDGASKKYKIPNIRNIHSMSMTKLKLSDIGVAKTMGPPFTKWELSELTNTSTLSTEHWDPGGEHYFTVYESTTWSPDIKTAHKGFTTSIKVPDNVQIIAARVKFEYSFFFTGWDTYGSKCGLQMVVGANKDFRSTTLDNWTDTTIFSSSANYMKVKYCVIDVFMPFDSITTNYGELHAEKQGEFTVDGLVKPNDNLQFNIGAGFMEGSQFGVYGHYLYGEVKLKKVTVTFLKTLN